MTQTIPELTDAQLETAARIEALDLEPVTYKLMHPEPGEEVMTLAEADQLTAAYRCYLKLCAWYPGQSVVPTKGIDEVWHAHILDTAKYAEDMEAAFGFFLHHFPYFGLRGPDDEAALRAAGEHTRELFRQHFGTVPGPAAARVCTTKCDQDGQTCDSVHGGGGQMMAARPRPDRSGLAAAAS